MRLTSSNAHDLAPHLQIKKLKSFPKRRSKSLQRASLVLLVLMPFVLYFAMYNEYLALAAVGLVVMAAGMLMAVLTQ